MRRALGFTRQALRTIPAAVFVLLPFIMLHAPYRTATRRYDARQTPRAAAIGVVAWLLIAAVAWGAI